MNWFDLVPEDVARNQIAWERRARIRRACQHLTSKEVAQRLGISPSRVNQLYTHKLGEESPVTRYCNHAFLSRKQGATLYFIVAALIRGMTDDDRENALRAALGQLLRYARMSRNPIPGWADDIGFLLRCLDEERRRA